MGYVFLRNGKCYIAYKRPDGRWAKEAAGTEKRTLAKALLIRREEEMLKARAAGLPVQSDIRLEEFVKEYLRHAAANKKPKSVLRDETGLKHLLPVFGKMRLREITAGAIQRYVDDRRLTPGKGGKLPRAATICNEVHTLSAIFREAVRRDLVLFNPVSKVKKPREDNVIVRYLLPDEDERLANALPPRIAPMVQFDLQTGLRKGELYRLTWQDVDLRQRVILVKHTKSTRRYVPLNDAGVAILKSLPRTEDSVHVFVDPTNGEAIKDIERAWRKALREAKITHFRFHDLRHTYASRLVQSGSSLPAVKELLGHRQISTTERYAHLGASDLREAVAKLPPPRLPAQRSAAKPATDAGKSRESDEDPNAS